jgi:hypothetical protein
VAGKVSGQSRYRWKGRKVTREHWELDAISRADNAEPVCKMPTDGEWEDQPRDSKVRTK